jgi:hypothetical protein
MLQVAEWQLHKTELRAFTNSTSGELIEVEPGGADTNGHFLHHVSALPRCSKRVGTLCGAFAVFAVACEAPRAAAVCGALAYLLVARA